MMRRRLKIEQHLLTYEHDSFLKVALSCQHSYYKGGVCTDIALELTPPSKYLLREQGFFFKEKGHFLFIGREKTNSDQDNAFNSILPPTFPEIVVQVKVVNDRFWLVTDFKALSEGYNPSKTETPLVFRNKDGGLSCANTDTGAFRALAKEHFKREPKDKGGLPALSKDVFALVLLDLKRVSDRQASFSLSLKAPAVKLRYKIVASKTNGKRKTSAKKLSLTDVLRDGKELKNITTSTEESPIRLQVKYSPKDDLYVLESMGFWKMRQENEHKATKFFKFEVEVKDSEKAKEGKAEVFLPFPSRIHSRLFKGEGKIKIVEQRVNLLRFVAKPSPVKQ